MYHLLPSCHVHVTIRIKFLVSECLLPYFRKPPCITTIRIWKQVLWLDPFPQHLHSAFKLLHPAHFLSSPPAVQYTRILVQVSFTSVTHFVFVVKGQQDCRSIQQQANRGKPPWYYFLWLLYSTQQNKLQKHLLQQQILPRLLMKIFHFTAVVAIFLYIYSNIQSCMYVQFVVYAKINLY